MRAPDNISIKFPRGTRDQYIAHRVGGVPWGLPKILEVGFLRGLYDGSEPQRVSKWLKTRMKPLSIIAKAITTTV